MKRFLPIAAMAAVFVSATAIASADTTDGLSGVSFKIGGFYPTESDTRANSQSTWLSAGIDYRLTWLKVPHLPKGYFSLSLDYAGSGDYRTAPLMLNYTMGKRIYLSVGGGVSFATFPQDDGTQNNQVRGAYSAAIGYNFNNSDIPLFLEVRYLGDDMPRVAGVGFYIGARF